MVLASTCSWVNKKPLSLPTAYLSSAGINSWQIDFSDEPDFGRLIGVLLSAFNLQTVYAALKNTLEGEQNVYSQVVQENKFLLEIDGCKRFALSTGYH